jgi:hypothetical protein
MLEQLQESLKVFRGKKAFIKKRGKDTNDSLKAFKELLEPFKPYLSRKSNFSEFKCIFDKLDSAQTTEMMRVITGDKFYGIRDCYITATDYRGEEKEIYFNSLGEAEEQNYEVEVYSSSDFNGECSECGHEIDLDEDEVTPSLYQGYISAVLPEDAKKQALDTLNQYELSEVEEVRVYFN